ncbi:MAG: hypothetical protein EYC62_01855 [Alphaproteobacteria bacterium]|nr:MAG: hypothetical protein EYC62_01855 [Alphaproteobacteria bacterium]
MGPRRKKPRYFFDEILTIRILDDTGTVVMELPGTSKRDYDAAMRRLEKINRTGFIRIDKK